MTDRPRFDVDDTTTSYTPPPQARPEWQGDQHGRAQPPLQQTPAHWLEQPRPYAYPSLGVGPLRPAQPPPPGRRGPGLAAIVLVSLLSASMAAGGTFALLQTSGRLDPPPAATPIAAQVSATATPVEQNVRVNEDSAVTDAATEVSPAVVTITSSGAPDDFTALPQTGVGSGIIYDLEGWIVTNRHVVCGADDLQVRLLDGREFDGEVYGIDTLTDLAIVRIDGGEDLPVAELGDSRAIRPGQMAIAIGSPLGTFTNSVTAGVVSALGREITVDDSCAAGEVRRLNGLIQTDAAINPGNSGGALLDSTGRVIGINTAVAGDAQGIGFAIPINIAKPIMRQAVAGEELARPWMGFFYGAVDPALQTREDLPIDYGVLVLVPSGATGPAVIAGSPADEAGLRAGDIITAIDGTRIDSTQGLDELLTRYDPGDELALDVLRDGETLELEIELGTRPSDL